MKRDRLEEMELPEGFRKLIRRLRRGGIIFHSSSLVFFGCACGALIFHWGMSWAIAAFIMSLVCRLTILLSVGRKYISAWKVAETPQIVYWAHSLDGQGRAIGKSVNESKNIRLHLKDGTQLEVEAVRGAGTSQEQLREIVSWLRQRNPSIRWGDYDKPCF
jgi:hypothetical protein